MGQLMIDLDYTMKALWHGAYFPRDKRLKFSERWRGNLDVNSSGKPETKKDLLNEFISSGGLCLYIIVGQHILDYQASK